MGQRRSERLRVAHLSTSKYRPTAAATLFRFRIRVAILPEGSSRLIRSTRPLGGVPEADMVNLSLEAFPEGSVSTRTTARLRPDVLERVMLRVSTSYSNTEHIHHILSALVSTRVFNSRGRYVYEAKETPKSPERGSCCWGETQKAQACFGSGGRLGLSMGMGWH